jgi:hypothetical protein
MAIAIVLVSFAMNSCGARKNKKRIGLETTNTTTDKSVVVEKNDSNVKTEVNNCRRQKQNQDGETIYKAN